MVETMYQFCSSLDYTTTKQIPWERTGAFTKNETGLPRWKLSTIEDPEDN